MTDGVIGKRTFAQRFGYNAKYFFRMLHREEQLQRKLRAVNYNPKSHTITPTCAQIIIDYFGLIPKANV